MFAIDPAGSENQIALWKEVSPLCQRFCGPVGLLSAQLPDRPAGNPVVYFCSAAGEFVRSGACQRRGGGGAVHPVLHTGFFKECGFPLRAGLCA